MCETANLTRRKRDMAAAGVLLAGAASSMPAAGDAIFASASILGGTSPEAAPTALPIGWAFGRL